jgi:hypothetical protein
MIIWTAGGGNPSRCAINEAHWKGALQNMPSCWESSKRKPKIQKQEVPQQLKWANAVERGIA